MPSRLVENESMIDLVLTNEWPTCAIRRAYGHVSVATSCQRYVHKVAWVSTNKTIKIPVEVNINDRHKMDTT